MEKIFPLTSILIASIALTSSLPAKAEVEDRVLVSYRTQQGMSDWYARNVQFQSGFEIAKATGNYNFDLGKLYAVLWFSQNQVAIVEVRESVLVSPNYSESFFRTARNIFPKISGYDQNDRYWEICISQNPRVFCN